MLITMSYNKIDFGFSSTQQVLNECNGVQNAYRSTFKFISAFSFRKLITSADCATLIYAYIHINIYTSK